MQSFNETKSNPLTKEQWKSFEEEGYLKLGKILTDQELSGLSKRIDDIMTGNAVIDYERLMMQRETGDGYDRSDQTLGFKGATLNYRKIQNLEYDPLFLSYIQKPQFRNICNIIYEKDSISCFRAMFMNKPAHNGALLAYHQDRWNHLNMDPVVTIWTALDHSTMENGCLILFPKTHNDLINRDDGSGFLNPEQTAQLLEQVKPVYLEVEAGESVLLHNWTVHGSEGNTSDKPRRAFSVCYMDANTTASDGNTFSVVFGPGALNPEQL
jgi:phytanoyl-CoA hydroxylase